MNYPHRLRVVRGSSGSAGTQDPETGVWTGNTTVSSSVIYDGPADVQDKNSVAARDASGLPLIMADGVAFLDSLDGVNNIQPDDVATITWEDGSTKSASVVRAVRLDQSVFLRY